MTRFHRVRPFRICTIAAGLLAGLAVSYSPVLAQTPASQATFDSSLPNDIQDWSDEVPAHIAAVDGEAWLLRDGTNEAAAENTPLLAGDRLRTGQGRIDIFFADGSILAFDHQTDAELLSDSLLRLDRGRVRLELTRAAGSAGYRVDAAGTTAWLQTAGEFRIQIDDRDPSAPRVQLLTIRGAAELSSGQERTLVRAGYEAVATASTSPSLPYAASVSAGDNFDRWWDARRNDRTPLGGMQYLPTEISYYGGVLDQNGEWGYEPSHGYVWYPRVDAAWQPYSSGRWSLVGSYGWVWIGADRWAWPTHHYGRWGMSGHRYYWIPGRNWAPAWVSWTSTPGYVGWCPIGYDNRPLVSVNIGFSTGWRGWTYAPSQGFHGRVVVANHGRGRYLPPRDGRFAQDFRGPARPAGFQPRATTGLRGPGYSSFAVPRNGERRATNQPAGRAAGDRVDDSPRAVSNGGTRTAPGNRATLPARSGVTPAARTSAPSVSTGDRQRDPFGRTPAVTPTARSRRGGPESDAATSSSATTPFAPSASDTRSRSSVPARARAPRAADGAATEPSMRINRSPAARSMPAPPAEREMREIPSATSGRAVRTMPANRTAGSMPSPASRARAPQSTPNSETREWSAPQPQRIDRSRPSSNGQERTANGSERTAPTQNRERGTASVPSSARGSRVEESRPAERQAPAGRSAPSDSGGGRAMPRARQR